MKKVWIPKIALLTICALLLVCNLSACKREEQFEFEVSEPDPEADQQNETEKEESKQEETKEEKSKEEKPKEEKPKEEELKEEKKEDPEKEASEEEKEEEPKKEETKEEASDNEELFEDEETDYSDYLTVVSYNIQCATYGKTWAGVVENIKSVDADIVGLQECDNGTDRTLQNGEFANQVEQLAHDLGYDHWYFGATLTNYRGGEYGHGILSRFPIKESDVTFFKAQNNPFTDGEEEKRNMERHILDIDGTEVVLYNTHLNGSMGFMDQFDEVMAAAEKDYAAKKTVIITGDFNIGYDRMKGHLDPKKFTPLNGNDTFMFGLAGITFIDNIIISKDITEYYLDESTQVGVKYLDGETEDSDHPMIYTHIKLPEKS